ncbi:pituitary homeobox 3-like isoform X3 [Pomacea canaliculata]|uniref:pituitary homeobox 3-like isoform X3 n=1 Tax=Pomacea canaliculata TaxID=400727 RepID=UPI000D727C1C|nr:pituitary homeobox 3-like isoform X3 [Pomacea canaliculata]
MSSNNQRQVQDQAAAMGQQVPPPRPPQRGQAAAVGQQFPPPPPPQPAVPEPDTTTPHYPQPRRHPRTILRDRQRRLLEAEFQRNHYPGVDVREDLARQTGLSAIRVREWFSNRRGTWRREQAARADE